MNRAKNSMLSTLLLACGFVHAVFSAEWLIYDDTFTMEEAGHGFHYFNHGENAPSNWTSPNDYYNGQWHVRYEIISQPTAPPCKLQTCIWADWEYPSHWTETCPVHTTLNGPGDVVEANGCPATWWNLHADDRVDFERPDQFRHLGVPLWSDNTKLVSDWVSDNDWHLRDAYFPLELRVTIVAVSSGSSFSGWKAFIKDPTPSPRPEMKFTHHVIDDRLGQSPGQMADVGRLGLTDIDNDGDLDFAMGVSHDGRLDVATVEQQDITWHISVSPRWIIWEQLDGNHWEENVVIDNGMAGHDMACGDVDGDGDPDLVAKVWNAYAADSGTWGTEEPEYVSYIENTTECAKQNSVKDR